MITPMIDLRPRGTLDERIRSRLSAFVGQPMTPANVAMIRAGLDDYLREGTCTREFEDPVGAAWLSADRLCVWYGERAEAWRLAFIDARLGR